MKTLFPETLRSLREKCGLKQRELAAAIGVDVPMYSRYEHGERRPKREHVVKLAKRLGTDPDELVASWLAFGALAQIGTDRLAPQAAALLKQLLGEEEPPVQQPQQAPVPKQERLTPPPIQALHDLPAHSSYGMPQFHAGDTLGLVARIADDAVDCVISSFKPLTTRAHVVERLAVAQELHRALKAGGSLWLHEPAASSHRLAWQAVTAMVEEQGWILADEVIWDKKKSLVIDDVHLASRHDHIWRFVKDNGQQHFNLDAYRKAFADFVDERRKASKTGQGYQRKIKTAAHMTPEEKERALQALNEAMDLLAAGQITDFRLYLRESGIPMSNDTRVGQEVNSQGFSLALTEADRPGDVWRCAPDKQGALPQQLCRLMLSATCPDGGLVLDVHCAIGNVVATAHAMQFAAVGLDTDAHAISELKHLYLPRPAAPQTLSLF